MTDRLFLRCFFVAVSWTVVVGTGGAQTPTGTIVGTVSDQSRALLPGVTITIENQATGVKATALTNDEGHFVVPYLQPGRYILLAQLQGFATAEIKDLVLQINQTREVQLNMHVGELTETVTVDEAVPLVDTVSSAVGQVIDNQRVVELPLNGRNFVQLATLSPGTSTRGTNQFTSEPDVNINGNRGKAAGFLIDGAENFEQNAETVMISPSIETIHEFKVQSSTFSAAEGRQAAVISVVTKSGTNQFRGNLFEFLRNENFDARNFFNPTSEAEPLKRNQFGGTFGGPAIRDRLFFFAAYEGTRERRGAVRNSLVPNAAQRGGDLSSLPPIFDPATTSEASRTRQRFSVNLIPATRLDSIALRTLQYIPLPNAPGDRFITSVSNKVNVDQYSFRGDYKPTQKDSFFARYTHNHRFLTSPGPYQTIVGGDDQDVLSLNGVFSYTRSFSPNTLNEFRFAATRFHLEFDTLSKDLKIIDEFGIQGLEGRKRENIEGFPILNVTGYGNFGDIGIRPLQQRFNTFTWADTFTWTRGNHTLRTGVDIRRYQRAAFNGIDARGNFSFTGVSTQNPAAPGGTGSGLADFLLGLPTSARRNFPRLRQQLFWTNVSSFVHDDWKLSRRLTLNLGLRHEFNGAPLEKLNRIGSFDFATGRPVAACDSSGQMHKDALIFFTPLELDSLQTSCGQAVGFPARSLRENNLLSFAPRFGFAYDLFGGGKTVIRGGYGIFYTLVGGNLLTRIIGSVPFFRGETFDTDRLLPTLTFAQAFPESTAFPVPDIIAFPRNPSDPYVQDWSFSIQQQLGRAMVLEAAYVGNRGTHLDINYQANQPPRPAAGAIQQRRPYPLFSTITLDTTVGYGNYHSLQVRAERRFGQGLSFLAAYTLSKSIIMAGQSQDPWNLDDGKGPAPYDIPQQFVFSTVYELPFGRNRTFLNRGGVVDAVLGGWQISGIVVLQSGVPFSPTTGRDSANVGTTTRPDRLGRGTVPEPTIDRWFDASAFANPAPFVFGTSGVNILRQDGFQSLDLSISKDFHFSESRYVQFRSEFFNTFNHPNFGPPNANINQPAQVGRVFSAADPRIVQLALKLFF
jgi:Carboxypeptidase regulatory-like domain